MFGLEGGFVERGGKGESEFFRIELMDVRMNL